MRTILTLALVIMGAAGCASASGAHGRVEVVAAENVYGDLARQAGGPFVHVTSILSDPSADPHLFTPRPSTILAVARARVVIRNGLGYDAFVQQLVDAADAKDQVVVTAGGDQANPHVWYSPAVVRGVATQLGAALERVDPRHRRAYERRRRRLLAHVERVERAEAAARGRYGGAPVAYTEPVPGYLVRAVGLRNLAPTGFTRAIEDGSEPTPDAVATMLDLVRRRRVRVLLYNSQAVSPITARVRDAARAAGVPVVGVTETLPPGESWQGWQLRQLRALERALAR